jgi:hypothetical protein
MADDIIDLLQVRIEKAKAKLPSETVNAIAAVDWKAAILGMRAKHGYTFEQLGDLELETELLLAGLLSPENYPKELAKRMKIKGEEANELVNEMNNSVFKKIREELVKNAERKKIFVSKSVPIKTEDEIKPLSSDINPTPQSSSLKILSKDIIAERAQLRKDGIEILDMKETSVITPLLMELPSAENTIKKIEKPEEKPKEEVHPMLLQKFSDSFQIPMVKTEYSLNNISKTDNTQKTIDEIIKTPIPEVAPAPKIKPISPTDVKIPKSYALNGDPYRLSPE